MLNTWQQHRERYPAASEEDAVKLIFQGMLGCGHLLKNEQGALDALLKEEAVLSPSSEEALTESLGAYYVRLNLRAAMQRGIRPEWIVRMMLASVEDAPSFTRSDVASEIRRLCKSGWLQENALACAQRLEADADWIPSHSPAYRAAYAPAYRVISRRQAMLLPVMEAVSTCLHANGRMLVTIDGRCGSGKTTLATRLSGLLKAPVVHMDSFHVPHAQKTPARLAQPGGNADIDRILHEFLLPWLTSGSASYRPYNCRQDLLMPAVTLSNAPIVILEGSYCNLPSIAKHASVRVFIEITPEEQRKRLLRREGSDGLRAFEERWIPLEEAYFSAFSLPDAGCVTVSTGM